MRTIDYVCICASGKGTRLKPLTQYIPKLLVTVRNKTMFHNVVDYWKVYTATFIIVINSKYKSLLNFYMSDYKDIEFIIKCVDENQFENAYTINKALSDEIFKFKRVLITWCDIVPITNMNDDIFGDSNVIFTYKDFGRYDASYDNQIYKKDSGNIIGIYFFPNFVNIHTFSNNMDICDCYIQNFLEFITYEINELIDIGDMDKYVIYSGHQKCREFNKISIEGNMFIKSATNKIGEKVMTNEIQFYMYHKKSGINIPEVYSHSCGLLKLELLNGHIVHDMWSIYDIDKRRDLLEKCLYSISTLHNIEKKMITNDILEFDIHYEFYEKVFNRINHCIHLIEHFGEITHIRFNNDLYVIKCSHNDIISQLYNYIKSYYKSTKNNEYVTIHGDCHFSNLLINNYHDIYYIDPRGYFGNTDIFGLKEYDLSKIFYSLSGFDLVNSNLFMNYDIKAGVFSFTFNNDIETFIDHFQLSQRKLLFCMVILHWFGLSGYNRNNTSKCLVSYYYAIYLFHRYILE